MHKRAAPAPVDLRCDTLLVDGVEYVVVSHRIDAPGRLFDGLSDAEREIVGRVVDGWSCARIADARGTSPRTVEKQLQAVYRKVGVGSRSALVAALSATPAPLSWSRSPGPRSG